MMVEPLAGRREAKVTETQTNKDFARCLEDLAEKTLSRCGKDRPGHGQSEHAYPGIMIRNVSTGASAGTCPLV
jgi:hypothetical protein